MSTTIAYLRPASRVVQVADIHPKVRPNSHDLLARIRRCEARRAVHPSPANWAGTPSIPEPMLDLLDRSINRRALDSHALPASGGESIVHESRIGHDPQPERLRMLCEERCGMLRLSLGNLVTPVSPRLLGRREELIGVPAQVLDSERIHDPIRILVTAKVRDRMR